MTPQASLDQTPWPAPFGAAFVCMTPFSPEPQRELIVLSDFHLGRGKNLESGRFWALEAFFYDNDFLAFVRWLISSAAGIEPMPRLIFNGDTFDLLRVEPESVGERAPAYLTPDQATRTLERILQGHPTFVAGLAEALVAGLTVVFLPGNHDIELQWAPVQTVLRDAVAAAVSAQGGDGAQVVGQLLSFRPWFYYEPGRVWIEHGCQYDPENAFRWYLRGDLAAVDADDTEVDQPLGNFFQRYLYNGFGAITFMVPSSRANFRYGRWLLLNNPGLLVRAATRHLPFAIRWLRRIALRKLQPPNALPQVHAAELAALAESSGLGDHLHRIEAHKQLRGDVVAAVQSITRNLLRAMLIAVLGTLMVAALWFQALDLLQTAQLGLAAKTMWFVAMTFLFFSGLTAGGMLLLLRDRPADELNPLPEAAARIAAQIGVPLVAFGHTHDETVTRLNQPTSRGWYYNTGTWIAVFTHDVLLPRDRVQYTFLRIRRQEGELLSWQPTRGDPIEVVLLDE